MKLAIGTAQFGLNYGVSNTHGKTQLEETNRILTTAWHNNIHVIDTAYLYGDSEKTLGESCCQQIDFNISTKTIKIQTPTVTKKDSEELNNAFHQSLKHLKKDRIYSLLLHDANDLAKPGSDLIVEKIKQIQAMGLIEKIGVSVYSRSQIELALTRFTPDIIQLPINVFDQRLLSDGFLGYLKRMKIELFARSIFLQGLLLMDTEKIPAYFSSLYKHISNYHHAVKQMELSLLESALLFVKNIKEIDYAIVGVNTNEQLSKILLANKIEKLNDWQAQFSINDENFINPMHWKI